MRKPKLNPRRSNRAARALAFGGLMLALAGCLSTDYSDLDRRIEEVLKTPARATVEPLPEVKVPETYAYQSAEGGKRDPFESFLKVKASEKTAGAAAKDPKTEALRKEIEGRNAEELEQFELDSLRMVGTLQDNNELWGIILDQSGTVHRVKVGNYMGKNFGKIMNISEEKIELREIIQTGDGGLEERPATVALSEQ